MMKGLFATLLFLFGFTVFSGDTESVASNDYPDAFIEQTIPIGGLLDIECMLYQWLHSKEVWLESYKSRKCNSPTYLDSFISGVQDFADSWLPVIWCLKKHLKILNRELRFGEGRDVDSHQVNVCTHRIFSELMIIDWQLIQSLDGKSLSSYQDDPWIRGIEHCLVGIEDDEKFTELLDKINQMLAEVVRKMKPALKAEHKSRYEKFVHLMKSHTL